MSCKADDTPHTSPVFYRLNDFAHPPLAGSADGTIVIPAGAIENTKCFKEKTDGLRHLSGAAIYAQLSSLDDAKLDDHLTAIIQHRLDGIVLRGCGGGMDVQHAGCLLAVHEALHNRPDGTTKIIAGVASTPAACFTLQTYVGSSPRLVAFIHAPRPLARALNIDLPAIATLEAADYIDPAPLIFARAQTVLAAAIAQVPAYLDMTWPAEDFETTANPNSAWERMALKGQQEGFHGHVSVITSNILKTD